MIKIENDDLFSEGDYCNICKDVFDGLCKCYPQKEINLDEILEKLEKLEKSKSILEKCILN